MRRLLPLALVLLAVPAFAQQAKLTTAIPRASEDNLRAETLYMDRGSLRWEIGVSVRGSGGTVIRRVTFSGPDAAHSSATLLALATAYTTALGNETGTLARRLDFRLMTFLSAQGYLTPEFGAHTVEP